MVVALGSLLLDVDEVVFHRLAVKAAAGRRDDDALRHMPQQARESIREGVVDKGGTIFSLAGM